MSLSLTLSLSLAQVDGTTPDTWDGMHYLRELSLDNNRLSGTLAAAEP